jgi:hypothetical protein
MRSAKAKAEQNRRPGPRGGADFLSVFEESQLDALVYLFLRLHGPGIALASIFWGVLAVPVRDASA